MTRVFSYKLVRDFGFAPNPYRGFCTLATCKPQIRAAARVGDLIVGCGSTSLSMENRVIFAMRVSEKISFQQYWDDARFLRKRPTFDASLSHAYGDNIYHHAENGEWIQEDSHHSLENGGLNDSNLIRDTGADYVLIARDFVYWGGAAILIPEDLNSELSTDRLYPGSRAHRSVFDAEFIRRVEEWFVGLPNRGIQGRPASW